MIDASTTTTPKLLLTKLYKPRASEAWVKRPQLLRALDGGLSHRLILVDAPAGYGKTTLLVQWLHALSLPSAWLSLDEADDNLVLFLTYVTYAVRTVYADSMPTTAILSSASQLPPVDDLVNTFTNELNALPGDLVLVLDDFHFVRSPEIIQLISRVVAHLPPNLHLVLVTRSDPPLPLASLRAKDKLLEIRAADLRFSSEEVHAFIRGAVREPLDESALRVLEEQTEGWPAGLRLAVLSMTASGDPQGFITAFASWGSSHITDYLADEVLARLPKPIQHFLLRASVPDRFCAPLCDVLCKCGSSSSGVPDTSTLLDEVKRRNLFLIPLDESGDWFRFHHLFRNLLRNKLRARLSPEAIVELQKCASEWLAAHGWVEEALQQAHAAGDTSSVIRLIEANMHDVLNREEAVALKRWLALVPNEIVQCRPRLLLAQAFQLTHQETAGVLPLVNRAEQLLQTGDVDLKYDKRAALMGDLLALRARATIDVDVTMGLSCAQWAERALELLPENHYYARATALAARAIGLQMAGQREEAEKFLEQEAARPGPITTYTLRVLQFQWNLAALGGNTAQASAIAERYLAASEAAGLIMNVCWAHTFVGLCRHEANDLQRAIEHFDFVVRQGQRASFRCQFFALSQLVLAHQVMGRSDLADAAVDALRARARLIRSPTIWMRIEAIAARLCLMRGDLNGAMHWVHASRDPAELWFSSMPTLVRAQILIAHRSAQALADAADALHELRHRAEAWRSHYQSARIMAVQASLLWVRNRHDEALRTMAEAATIGQRGGLIRAFADCGEDVHAVVRALTERAACYGLAEAYLAVVLDAFGGVPDAARHESKHPYLTQREVDVLELLSRRRSDKEIAGVLFISRLTVSKHTANIYRKLGVSSRHEAVAKARMLGILSSA